MRVWIINILSSPLILLHVASSIFSDDTLDIQGHFFALSYFCCILVISSLINIRCASMIHDRW